MPKKTYKKRRVRKPVEEVTPVVNTPAPSTKPSNELPVVREIGRPKKRMPKIKKSPPPLKKI